VRQVDDAKVTAMLGADVLSWKVDGLEFAASEVQGPVVVTMQGETVAVYPFYAQPVLNSGRRNPALAGTLHVWDPRQRRYIGEHQRGTWDEVQHQPRYSGFTIAPRGGLMVRG